MSDSIDRQEAIAAAKAVCLKILGECKSHFDPEIGPEVYSDIREVEAVLKCNKYICKALRELSTVKDSGK
jgi:hypothetical protein